MSERPVREAKQQVREAGEAEDDGEVSAEEKDGRALGIPGVEGIAEEQFAPESPFAG